MISIQTASLSYCGSECTSNPPIHPIKFISIYIAGNFGELAKNLFWRILVW